MSPSFVFCTTNFVSLFSGLVFVSMATLTGASRGELGRPHIDECGPSVDNSLICCPGLQQSTMIRRDEQCCNGRALPPRFICCDNVTSVPQASPHHNACCLQPGTPPRGVTFNSRGHYCNRRTGRVRRVPFTRGPRLTSRSRASLATSLLSSLATRCRVRRAKGTADREREGEDEEEIQCCGRVPYRPSRQTCCEITVHNVPANQTQCCHDLAFPIGDSANPCLGRCGSRAMDLQTQLCCGGKLHNRTSRGQMCCGKHAMDSRTHVCCGRGRVPVHKELGEHGCCEDGTLYQRRYTRCSGSGDEPTRGPLRRKPVDFTARTLCQRALPTWGRHWPDINMAGQVLQLEGQVTKVKKNFTHLILTLNSFRIISPTLASLRRRVASASSCIAGTGSTRLRVIIDLRDGAGRTPLDCHGRELRRYLNGSALTTLSPLDALSCTSTPVPLLSIPNRSADILLLRRESSSEGSEQLSE